MTAIRASVDQLSSLSSALLLLGVVK